MGSQEWVGFVTIFFSDIIKKVTFLLLFKVTGGASPIQFNFPWSVFLKYFVILSVSLFPGK